jgi:hypothetical protein
MNELRNIVEQAHRAIAPIPPPPDGFAHLAHRRDRRHRHNRAAAAVLALAIAAGGGAGGVAIARGLHHPMGLGAQGRTTPPVGATPSAAFPGVVVQRTIDGEPAQRLGVFWFGVIEEPSCLRAAPLPIGPSWTFHDSEHDCVPALGSEPIRAGQATGTVHRDGDAAPATPFTVVYGRVAPETARIQIVWDGGQRVTVSPVNGRFLLVVAGSAQTFRVEAVSSTGDVLGTVDPA